MKNESVTANGLQMLFKRKLLIFLMSPSLEMRPGSRYVDIQSTRLWSSENLYAVHEKPLLDQKLGLWVEISRRRIVGPLFFEETVNNKRDCSMLLDFIGLLEEYEITYSWFQKDGANAHTANNSMKLLNEIFGAHVISRNLWPLRSSDLTPPDFYLWGAAKSAVYRDRPRTRNELKTAITAYIRNISQGDLQKVFANKIK
jgi:hypothetical protein